MNLPQTRILTYPAHCREYMHSTEPRTWYSKPWSLRSVIESRFAGVWFDASVQCENETARRLALMPLAEFHKYLGQLCEEQELAS